MNHLVRAWERTVQRHGDERAVLEAGSGQAATFREIDHGAAALGFSSRELAGRAVVFALPNGRRWCEVFVGLIRAGAIATPLDPGEPASAPREIATSIRAGFWWDGTRLVAVPMPRRFRNPDTCVIKLTSGTTGRPRPLVFTATQMLADARQVTASMGIRRTDLNYALIPFGHSYGLGNLSLPLLAHGVPVVCGAAPLPHAVADDFARWKPTVFPSVPAVFESLVAAEVPPEAFASLRLAISAGAPLAVETAAGFAAKFRRRIHAFYGSSETGGIAYDRTGTMTLAGGVGTALRGVRLSVPRPGQLRVCSPAVFTLGNVRRAGVIGCWIPPDRATRNERGQITLLGRRGTTVKLAGRRVNLAEIVLRLRRLPGVREAWVGVSAERQSVLGAAVVSNRTVGELRAELAATTSAWKVPRKWALLPQLPLTSRGKIDTRLLQARVFGPSL